MAFNWRWPHVSGVLVLLHGILLIPTFGPATFSALKWWETTSGLDRYAAVGAVVFLEVALALTLSVAFAAYRERHWGRVVATPLAIVLLWTLSGAMLWQPVASTVEARFPRPVMPDWRGAEREIALVAEQRQDILDAQAANDVGALQWALLNVGVELDSVDADFGPATRDALIEAQANLTRRERDASAVLDQAEDVRPGLLQWQALVAGGIAVILFAVTFSRWFLLGIAKPAKPKEPEPVAFDPTYTFDDFINERMPKRTGKRRIGERPSDFRPNGRGYYIDGEDTEEDYRARALALRTGKPALRLVSNA